MYLWFLFIVLSGKSCESSSSIKMGDVRAHLYAAWIHPGDRGKWLVPDPGSLPCEVLKEVRANRSEGKGGSASSTVSRRKEEQMER